MTHSFDQSPPHVFELLRLLEDLPYTRLAMPIRGCDHAFGTRIGLLPSSPFKPWKDHTESIEWVHDSNKLYSEINNFDPNPTWGTLENLPYRWAYTFSSRKVQL